MKNLGWSLEMTLLGMGAVFLLLILLMVVLMAIGRIDSLSARRRHSAELEEDAGDGSEGQDTAVLGSSAPRAVIGGSEQLTAEQIAAVAVAVMVHVDPGRGKATPADRSYAPGSRLWASRWVSAGRASQMRNTRR